MNLASASRIEIHPIQRCPLCGSEEHESILQEFNNFEYSYASWSYLNAIPVNVNRCQSCTFAFTAALPEYDFFQNVLYSPPETATPWEPADKAAGKDFIFSSIIKLLKKYAAGPSLLDLGACSGRFLFLARQVFAQCSGIENDPRAVMQAKALGLNVQRGMIKEKIKEFSGQVDSITLIDVLEHLTDPLGHLQAIHNTLPQSGLLYIKVPHQWGQLCKEKFISSIRIRQTKMATNYVHINHFSERSLVNALEKIGFQVLHANVACPELYFWNTGIKTTFSNILRLGQYGLARCLRNFTPYNLGLNLEILARKR